jgi:predicted SpoU family rRNA methylase
MGKKIEIKPGDEPEQVDASAAEIVRQWGASLGVDATLDGERVTIKTPHGETRHKIEDGLSLDDLMAALDLIRTNDLMV